MKWLRVGLSVSHAEADAARAALLLEEVAGWEETEDEDSSQFAFYVPKDPTGLLKRAAVIERLEASLSGSFGVLKNEVDDEDWAHAWKRFWKPQRIGQHLVVVPSWETFAPQPGDHVITLDPGMAFGTGTHETTRMCLEWLEKVIRAGDRVLDVGTGSGLLAIGALKLGAASALGIDNDPIAVTAARENLDRNGVGDRAEVRLGSGLPEEGAFEVITANLVADLVVSLAPGVPARVAPAGCFIGSGIILEREADVDRALNAAGLHGRHWAHQGEWASVAARR